MNFQQFQMQQIIYLVNTVMAYIKRSIYIDMKKFVKVLKLN